VVIARPHLVNDIEVVIDIVPSDALRDDTLKVSTDIPLAVAWPIDNVIVSPTTPMSRNWPPGHNRATTLPPQQIVTSDAETTVARITIVRITPMIADAFADWKWTYCG
jgi:hypothetical protein